MKYTVVSTESSNYKYAGYSSWDCKRFNTIKDAVDHLGRVGFGDYFTYLGFVDEDDNLVVFQSGRDGNLSLADMTTIDDDILNHF
jgi:hypothetical protein